MDCSVLIPTYNRFGVLVRTLRALEKQFTGGTGGEFTFEVIVVDDGSTDQTGKMVPEMVRSFQVPLRYYFQSNRKQGAARNLGARQARGTYLVLLGDDTIPRRDFLREHYRRHLESEEPKLVVIGYTPWAEEFRTTRFMEYIGEQGWQFGFALIEDPDNVPFNFFYTSNLSISREFFRSAGGFDESFQEYGWEDMELGFRLKGLGMRLVYHPRAQACHYHPTSIASFVRRQKRVGNSAWTFYRKHPEMDQFLNVTTVPEYSLWEHLKMRALTGVCRLAESWTWPDLSAYYPDLMSYYYNLGIREARDE